MTTLVHEPDPAVGAWIGPRLLPFGQAVGSVVPTGFEAYARILHPVPGPATEEAGSRLVRWADVAAVTGRVVHGRAQFWRVAARRHGHDQDPGAWLGQEPSEGDLDAADLAALLDLLAHHTVGGADGRVVVGLWDGCGWIRGGGAVSVAVLGAGGTSTVPHPGPAFDPSVLGAPRLELPAREYLLLRGTLADVPTLGHDLPWGAFSPQSPHLLWPDDTSWCVATEIDLDSTFVGGSRALVDRILADERLEAFETDVHDGIGIEDDDVNT